ncbi:sialic acid-induced transmembrane protein YjhT possible mutarotase [Vibrio maritimus]|uniref:Sialic acid-induced transmembrane protein YjhT possible mutarotase n=1 Tax=Vibrio maritimus TaxID=990268 RepID=A0A090T752_9VIBR|nr:sialic acid-induced transmembrane protein YjhT possible mutarotase [Vibrio maritimus]
MNIRKMVTLVGLSTLLVSAVATAKDAWPDLPQGIKSGVSAQIGNKLYAGLGSSGQAFYMLDTTRPELGWQQLSDFIGPARNGATATAIGSKIYVFGGAGKTSLTPSLPSFLTQFTSLIPFQTVGV